MTIISVAMPNLNAARQLNRFIDAKGEKNMFFHLIVRLKLHLDIHLWYSVNIDISKIVYTCVRTTYAVVVYMIKSAQICHQKLGNLGGVTCAILGRTTGHTSQIRARIQSSLGWRSSFLFSQHYGLFLMVILPNHQEASPTPKLLSFNLFGATFGHGPRQTWRMLRWMCLSPFSCCSCTSSRWSSMKHQVISLEASGDLPRNDSE